MEFLTGLHRDLGQYLIPALAALGSLRALYGGWRTDSYRKWDRALGLVYTGLLDLQLLIGLWLFFVGQRRPEQWHGHLTFMILAVLVAHIGSIGVQRWAQTESAQQRLQFFTYVVSLLLIIMGLWFTDVF
jgi:hypothetical protein